MYSVSSQTKYGNFSWNIFHTSEVQIKIKYNDQSAKFYSLILIFSSLYVVHDRVF